MAESHLRALPGGAGDGGTGHGDGLAKAADDGDAPKAGHAGALVGCSLITTMRLLIVARYIDVLMGWDPVSLLSSGCCLHPKCFSDFAGHTSVHASCYLP